MPDPSDPIQAQLIEARTRQILDAATQVFAERGYHAATIKQIARVAGIADGTVYTYFPNKEALLFALLHRLNETPQRAAGLQVPADARPQEHLSAYLAHRLSHLEEHLTLLRALLPELLVHADLQEKYRQDILNPTYQLGEGMFRGLMEQGVLPEQDPVVLTRILSSTLLGLSVLRLLGDPATETHWPQIQARVQQMLGHLMQGEDHA